MSRTFTGFPGVEAFQMLTPPVDRLALPVATKTPEPAREVIPVPNAPTEPM
jgi:hypothetical protein